MTRGGKRRGAGRPTRAGWSPFSIKLPDELQAELRAIAEAEGRPLQDVTADYLRRALRPEDRP